MWRGNIYHVLWTADYKKYVWYALSDRREIPDSVTKETRMVPEPGVVLVPGDVEGIHGVQHQACHAPEDKQPPRRAQHQHLHRARYAELPAAKQEADDRQVDRRVLADREPVIAGSDQAVMLRRLIPQDGPVPALVHPGAARRRGDDASSPRTSSPRSSTTCSSRSCDTARRTALRQPNSASPRRQSCAWPRQGSLRMGVRGAGSGSRRLRSAEPAGRRHRPAGSRRWTPAG
jgi:hypothetical protein